MIIKAAIFHSNVLKKKANSLENKYCANWSLYLHRFHVSRSRKFPPKVIQFHSSHELNTQIILHVRQIISNYQETLNEFIHLFSISLETVSRKIVFIGYLHSILLSFITLLSREKDLFQIFNCLNNSKSWKKLSFLVRFGERI